MACTWQQGHLRRGSTPQCPGAPVPDFYAGLLTVAGALHHGPAKLPEVLCPELGTIVAFVPGQADRIEVRCDRCAPGTASVDGACVPCDVPEAAVLAQCRTNLVPVTISVSVGLLVLAGAAVGGIWFFGRKARDTRRAPKSGPVVLVCTVLCTPGLNLLLIPCHGALKGALRWRGEGRGGGLAADAACARATHGVGKAYVLDGRDNAWRSRAPRPHAYGNAARQVVDGLRTEVWGQQKQSKDPTTTSKTPIHQLLGAADAQTAHPATSSKAPAHQPLLHKRRNDTSRSTGRSG